MRVIGLGSGRRGKVTESLVRMVLESTGMDHDFISLSGKLVRPCEACNGCVDTNTCVLPDDFSAIAERVQGADGLVFGAPTYWARMNAKGSAFWERLCFSGRHSELFPMKGMPAAMVAIDGSDGTGEHVLADTKRYFADARLDVVGHVSAQGEYACFTCGLGEECSVGGFHTLYGEGISIAPERIPSMDNQCPHLGDGEGAIRGRVLRDAARRLGERLARRIQSRPRRSPDAP